MKQLMIDTIEEAGKYESCEGVFNRLKGEPLFAGMTDVELREMINSVLGEF